MFRYVPPSYSLDCAPLDLHPTPDFRHGFFPIRE